MPAVWVCGLGLGSVKLGYRAHARAFRSARPPPEARAGAPRAPLPPSRGGFPAVFQFTFPNLSPNTIRHEKSQKFTSTCRSFLHFHIFNYIHFPEQLFHLNRKWKIWIEATRTTSVMDPCAARSAPAIRAGMKMLFPSRIGHDISFIKTVLIDFNCANCTMKFPGVTNRF